MPSDPTRSDAESRLAANGALSPQIVERLVLAIEQGSEGIAIVDMNGDIEYVNGAFAEMHGYTPEELLGCNLATFHNAAQMPAVEAANRQIAATGRFVGEIWHARRDGSVFPTMMHNSLIIDDEGNAVGILGTLRDTSEMKRAELALARSQQRFRHAAEATSDLIYEWDVESGQLEWFGDIDGVLGYDRGAFPRTLEAWFGAIHPEDQALLADSVTRHKTSTAPIYEEYRVRTRDGSYLYWIDRASPVLDDDGRPRRWVGACLDVTPQRHAEEARRQFERELFQAQKLESLGVLAGGIAHDFNNLLTGVLGNADLALLDLPPGSPTVGTIEAILVAAQRCSDLAQHLLAYSGRGRLLSEPVDLSDVVAGLSPLLRTAVAKKIAVIYDLAEGLPAIEADATQLRQVVMNLITNAAEAYGDGAGRVWVSTGQRSCDRDYLEGAWLDAASHVDGRFVFVAVEDHGAGIPEDALDKIFDPFFSSKFTGRGLGLAAALGIVRSHSGVIRIESQVGVGSTFTVLFPVTADARPHDGRAASKRQAPGGGGTVLLVDDEDTVREVGRRMLERLGYRVLLAHDGVAALALFREHSAAIDCVLLDLTMPEMDGLETYRELQRLRADVPVVLSSGYNEEEEEVSRFRADNPTCFLQKPYDLAALASCLRNALAR